MALLDPLDSAAGQDKFADLYAKYNLLNAAVNAITANNVVAMKRITTTWNGDTTPSINVAHGLTLSKIVWWSFSVMNNAGTAKYTAGTFDTGTIALFEGIVDATNVQLIRTGSTIIDGPLWNAATVEIIIIYEK